MVNGTRMSGEATTTTGNTLINYLLQSYIYKMLDMIYKIICAGDDSAARVNALNAAIDTIRRAFGLFGLSVQIKQQNGLEGLGFLSSKMV